MRSEFVAIKKAIISFTLIISLIISFMGGLVPPTAVAASGSLPFTHRGSRVGCTAVVAEALKYVGHHPRPNIFTNYAGLNSEWCAMFVNYVFENTGNCSLHSHAHHKSLQIRSWSCTTIMNTARAQGRFVDGNYTNPAPGDWILFNWGSQPWNVA